MTCRFLVLKKWCVILALRQQPTNGLNNMLFFRLHKTTCRFSFVKWLRKMWLHTTCCFIQNNKRTYHFAQTTVASLHKWHVVYRCLLPLIRSFWPDFLFVFLTWFVFNHLDTVLSRSNCRIVINSITLWSVTSICSKKKNQNLKTQFKNVDDWK